MLDEKGISSEYHMIAGLKVAGDRLEIILKSYTEKAYRQLEKEIESNNIKSQALIKQHYEEMRKEKPDFELINNLAQQITSLNVELKDYAVNASTYVLPFNKADDLSYAAIYEKLKLEAIFADAEDC